MDRLRRDDADVTTMFWCQRDEDSDFPIEYLRGRDAKKITCGTHVRKARVETRLSPYNLAAT